MKKILIAAEPARNYCNAVSGVGAIPFASLAEHDLSAFDALILPGGGDVEPSRFGQENNGSTGINPELDRVQFALLDAFINAGKPVLGICRGVQVINVYFGGSLIQDLPNARSVHSRDEHDNDRVHLISAEPESFISRLYGAEFAVNSAHHQGLDRVGNGLIIAGRSIPDGVIEAVEHASMPVYGVQWHPERMCFSHLRPDTADGEALFRWFTEII